MLLSLCLAAALLCSTCAFAADTADEEQPANSVVLSDGEEPENGTVPPEGDEPDDGTVSPDGDEPDDGINPGIILLDVEAEHEHEYVAGKCACGDVLPEYEWYYSSTGMSYSIETVAEMVALSDIVNNLGYTFEGETISLTADIDLTGIAWSPIGGGAEAVYLEIASQEELRAQVKEHGIIYDDNGFSYNGSENDATYAAGMAYYYVRTNIYSGTFDGNGHTISGMKVSSDMGYIGLFGNVNGTLQNFSVNGKVTYTGSNGDYIGGVTGMLSAGGTISGVTSTVNVLAEAGYNVGGIVGFVGTPLSAESANNTIVTMCVNKGSVIGYHKVGGIAGENAGSVKLCVNSGSVDGMNHSSKNGVGGIVGRNGNNDTAIEKGTVINCYNTGYINYHSDYREFTPKWSGGIVGFNDALSSVINCYTTTTPKLALTYSNPIIGNDESYMGSGVVENNYALYYDGISYTGSVEREIGIQVTSAELMALAGTVTIDEVERSLGDAYVKDSEGINSCYPILAWQAGPSEGYAVTVNNQTGTAAPATITGLTSDGSYSGSVTFTVNCDQACVAAYTTDGGETYTRLTAAANANNGYDFTVEVSEAVEIVVAVKGDVNGDGNSNSVDLTILRGSVMSRVTLNSAQKLTGDVNGDGKVNSTDLTMLRGRVMSRVTLPW